MRILQHLTSRLAMRRLPIGIQLSVLVFTIVIIVLIVLYTNYLKAAQVVEKKNSEYLSEMIAQINHTIASNSDAVKRIIQNIAYNPKIVQQYLIETDPVKKMDQYTQLVSYLSDMMSMKDGIVDIALIGVEGTRVNLNGDLNLLQPFVKEIPPKQLFYYTGMQRLLNSINNNYRNVFIVGCPIYSMIDFENGKEIGTLMIVIDANALLGSPPGMTRMDGSKLYALDRNRNVFFSNDEAVQPGTPYSQLVLADDDSSFFVQKGPIPDIGGELVFKLPRRELLSGIEDIRKQSFLILIVSLALLAFPFFLVVNNILRPLKKLMRFMNDFKLGHLRNLSHRISLQGYAEISSMANDFNRMMDEIDGLTKQLLDSNTKLYRAELVKKQSELAYLQSQINPHFLYNTLESIKGLAVEEGSDKIFHMVKALAFVFRYSIKTADIVTLQEELTLAKSHIHIQQIRFGNRFRVHYRIPDDLLEIKIPKMILQPLVENAIFHGLEARIKDGVLEIAAERIDELLVLSVTDNGAGLTEEELHALEANLAVIQDMAEGQRKSIGLVNVNNRIKLSYGDAFGITITSKFGVGTMASIRLPLGRVDDA